MFIKYHIVNSHLLLQIRLWSILILFSFLHPIKCNQYKDNILSVLDKRKPEQYHIQTQDGHYEYGYSTKNSAKYEIKTKDGITRGSYSYIDPTSVLRVTNYVSDTFNGYRARNTEHGSSINAWDATNGNTEGDLIFFKKDLQYNIKLQLT